MTAPQRRYVGSTTDLERRLREHNQGKSKYTGRFGRWRYETVIAVNDSETASHLERYFKSGSGREFARTHFRRSEKR